MDTEKKDKRAEYLKGKIPMRVTNKYQAFLYRLFFLLRDPENDQEAQRHVKMCKTNTESFQNFHKPQKSLYLV